MTDIDDLNAQIRELKQEIILCKELNNIKDKKLQTISEIKKKYEKYEQFQGICIDLETILAGGETN